MLNFFSSCLPIPEVLFPGEGNVSTWVNPGHFKRMEVSSIGTSSTHWRCVPRILPPPTPQTPFPVGFVILPSSTPSYCYCVSQSSSLYSSREIRAVTQSPSPLQRWWRGCMTFSEYGILMRPDSVLPALQCIWGKGSHSSCYPPYPLRLLHF